MKFIIATMIAGVTAGTAFAGSLDTTIAEPTPILETSLTPQDINWTGGYAGLQYGQGDGELSFGGETIGSDGDALGIHAGYLNDLGQYVVGGELSFDRLSADGSNGDADLLRLRGRAGVDLGTFMPYVTLGFARYSEEGLSETGLTYGIGAEYLVTDQFGIGLEYSRSAFSDVGGVNGLDIDIDMIQLRASYHF